MSAEQNFMTMFVNVIIFKFLYYISKFMIFFFFTFTGKVFLVLISFVFSITGEVNRLELELQRVQKENLKNEALLQSEKEDYTSNGESKPEDYVNRLETEIHSLKSNYLL